MAKKTSQKQAPKHLTESRVERLLSVQTTVILNAVDKRLTAHKDEILGTMDKRFDAADRRFTAVEKRIDALEERFTHKLNQLTNTLDKFLKRMTDMEDEFVFMKEDIKRIKALIREKLGVAIN